ncbi:RNA polymerase sigma factor (sigma-70 family) [Runella defluvii]|uniref:RNA polymerase sigma factor (Sigma-70 family) n=1 Tax=Runella defluvii TaxID=370973 RepID=A0A7W5ZII6_9BACT|nr:sigma-70 family RNA polymerase sigma factor [Runella defluvii]MBB3836366.1 RNA polymerase sigma factor (sigma-70 family) [Runella defluvii]
MDETQLWKGFLNADQKAFEGLFKKYYRPLYLYGYKIVRNTQLLDDCIQDLFFELWTSKERLGEVTSVKGYLFKALKFKLTRELRKENRFDAIEEEPNEWFEISHESWLIEQQTDHEQKERLTHLISQLTKRQQEALYLRFFSQLNYDEIAEVMKLTYQAVVNLIYKSVKFLREHLVPFLILLIQASLGVF